MAEVALKPSLPVKGVVPGPRDGVWGRGYLKIRKTETPRQTPPTQAQRRGGFFATPVILDLRGPHANRL